MSHVPGSMTSVSVVIPCRNEMRFIETCLTDLLGQEGVPDQYEIVIAEGGSDDGTAILLEKIAAENLIVRIVDNPKRIVPTGLNAAILVANGKIIVRADVHTRYAKDYVAQCLAALEVSDAACVGGPWLAAGAGYIQRAIAAAFGSPLSSGGARSHSTDHEGDVDSVYLGCWRKSTLLNIGLFDESLVRNQDDELNLRLKRHGLRLWQTPRIRSWYYPRDSLFKLFRQYFQYGYWKVPVILKHRLPASWRHVVPASVVALGSVLAVTATVSPTALALLLSSMGAYVALTIYSSIAACRTARDWSLLLVLPLVFFVYHVAYGLGFLRGLWVFGIRGRRGTADMMSLTR